MIDLIEKSLIPWDKSWIIRLGILDLVEGDRNIHDFLNSQKELSDDLVALKRVAETWHTQAVVDVGESGTLYRFLKFLNWKNNLQKKFLISGTLKNRMITDNSEIINWSQEKLLKLDNNTSQWASAAALCGDEVRLPNPPFKLALTYKAIDHWKKQRTIGQPWIPHYDQTILNQALAFLDLKSGMMPNFKPDQAEDYCFSLAFGFVDKAQGQQLWPSLTGHESNRFKEMDIMMQKVVAGEPVDSHDHRVIQALAMWANLHGGTPKFLYPQAVNKSWPQFWRFLETVK